MDDIATALCLFVIFINFTNMHAMSHRSDFYLTYSSKGNLSERAFYQTITKLLTVTQMELPRVQFPNAMSDTKSLNTSLLEVMISSKNEYVLIWDLSDFTLHITFDAWWDSMKVGLKRPVGWKHSRHTACWRFY
jgi:hypothetical protein